MRKKWRSRTDIVLGLQLVDLINSAQCLRTIHNHSINSGNKELFNFRIFRPFELLGRGDASRYALIVSDEHAI